MTPSGFHRRSDDFPRDGADASDELRDLAAQVPAPDFTEQIMGRLGYQRVSERSARRQRARRRLLRAGALFSAALAIAGGMHYYTLQQRAQRAGMPTIQNAVSTSVEDGHRAVTDFSRALREVLTPEVAPWPPQQGPFDAPLHRPDRFFEWVPGEEPLNVSRVRWSGLL